MQTEVNKLESEIIHLQNLLKISNTTQVSFEIFKEGLEAEKERVKIQNSIIFYIFIHSFFCSFSSK